MLALIFILLIFLPYNYIYINLERWFPYPFVTNLLDPIYWLYFAAQLMLVSFGSMVAFILTVLYYRRRSMQVSRAREEQDRVRNMFDYFLEEDTLLNTIVVFTLLIYAAFNEEMVYRYFLVNILAFLQIPLVIVILISGIVFGLVHLSNKYIGYVFSATFSGIVFAWCFVSFGLIGAFVLHVMWNAWVLFQDKVFIWANKDIFQK
jgi:membrane protease YdiL (CAAX protease family)